MFNGWLIKYINIHVTNLTHVIKFYKIEWYLIKIFQI